MSPTVLLLLLTSLLLSSQVGAQEKEYYLAQDEHEHRGSGVRFTRPDGSPIYVNPRAVAYVRAPLPGEHGKATIVFTSGAIQQVAETVEQVINGIHIDMPKDKN